MRDLIPGGKEQGERKRVLTLVIFASLISATIGFGLAALSVPSPSSLRAKTSSISAKLTKHNVLPDVDLEALSGHGNIAFVYGGRLYVADGSEQKLRNVAGPHSTVFSPLFSHDGKWLAFLTYAPNTQSDEDVLWLAKGNGTDARRVGDIPLVHVDFDAGESPIAWSSTSDNLLVTTGPLSPVGIQVPRRVWIVPTQGKPRQLLPTGFVGGAIWSPDGRSIAVIYSSVGLTHEAIEVVSIVGGATTIWYQSPLNISFAGWYPGTGIVIWDGWYGPDTENFGVPLSVLHGPNESLVPLTKAAIFQPPVVSGGPNGEIAITANTGGGNVGEGVKFVWFAKAVETCSDALGSCSEVAMPSGNVSLNPAWSPNGSELAFVEAPQSNLGIPSGYPNYQPYQNGFVWSDIAPWYSKLTLWLLPMGSSQPAQVRTVSGASDPTWSSDSKSLMYVSSEQLWLLAALGAHPFRLAPVDGATGYLFGYADWIHNFAWWSGQ